MLISITDTPLTGRLSVVLPMNEKTKTTSSDGTLKSYSPFASVTVPILVPSIYTLTPGRGSFVLCSITTPLIALAC